MYTYSEIVRRLVIRHLVVNRTCRCTPYIATYTHSCCDAIHFLCKWICAMSFRLSCKIKASINTLILRFPRIFSVCVEMLDVLIYVTCNYHFNDCTMLFWYRFLPVLHTRKLKVTKNIHIYLDTIIMWLLERFIDLVRSLSSRNIWMQSFYRRHSFLDQFNAFIVINQWIAMSDGPSSLVIKFNKINIFFLFSFASMWGGWKSLRS